MKKIMRSTFGRLLCKNWVLAATLVFGASVLTACTSNDDNSAVDDGLAEKVLGKWILSEVEGHPLPTNDKVVFTFAENDQFFLSMSRVDNTDEYLKWDNRILCQLKRDGDTFTITGSTADGNIEAIMKVRSITETELLADMDFTIVAPDSTHHEKMTQLYTRTPDYTEDILGLWEGRISSEQSVYDDNLDHRWEYKDDGSYLYYRHTADGQWVADVNLMSVYFVDGCLLCTRWEGNDGVEYREWWEIESIEDGVMKWNALRLNDDGSPFYATFQMKRVDNSLSEMIVGKWIHADTDGETVTTDMMSVYTFEKNGDVLKGYYSMSMTESGVWAYNQETDVAVSGNNITLTSHLAGGVTSVVELTGVTVSGNDMRFTAKTTLLKNGQVTATYGPRQEHFTKTVVDYTNTVIGLWDIYFTSDDPEHESLEPYRELYRADGTCSFYDLVDGQWVEEKTDYSEYFADGPLFCFRWQKSDAGTDRRENWEIVSYENGKMVSKAFHRRADGSTYTITAHLTKVE